MAEDKSEAGCVHLQMRNVVGLEELVLLPQYDINQSEKVKNPLNCKVHVELFDRFYFIEFMESVLQNDRIICNFRYFRAIQYNNALSNLFLFFKA